MFFLFSRIHLFTQNLIFFVFISRFGFFAYSFFGTQTLKLNRVRGDADDDDDDDDIYEFREPEPFEFEVRARRESPFSEERAGRFVGAAAGGRKTPAGGPENDAENAPASETGAASPSKRSNASSPTVSPQSKMYQIT